MDNIKKQMAALQKQLGDKPAGAQQPNKREGGRRQSDKSDGWYCSIPSSTTWAQACLLYCMLNMSMASTSMDVRHGGYFHERPLARRGLAFLRASWQVTNTLRDSCPRRVLGWPAPRVENPTPLAANPEPEQNPGFLARWSGVVKVWRTLSKLFSTARAGTRKEARLACRLTLKRLRRVCGCMVFHRPRRRVPSQLMNRPWS
eukprot:5647182-Amphidinium_carterae.1